MLLAAEGVSLCAEKEFLSGVQFPLGGQDAQCLGILAYDGGLGTQGDLPCRQRAADSQHHASKATSGFPSWLSKLMKSMGVRKM